MQRGDEDGGGWRAVARTVAGREQAQGDLDRPRHNARGDSVRLLQAACCGLDCWLWNAGPALHPSQLAGRLRSSIGLGDYPTDA